MHIKLDDLTDPKIHALLEEHLEDMRAISPPESVHALDLEKLRKPDITFWSAWDGEELLGCGALKALSPGQGEVKSMRTSRGRRRGGVARAILQRILDEANSRSYETLSLETGSQVEFQPAQALYRSFGFNYCGPFEGYVEDPNSVFMTKMLP